MLLRRGHPPAVRAVSLCVTPPGYRHAAGDAGDGRDGRVAGVCLSPPPPARRRGSGPDSLRAGGLGDRPGDIEGRVEGGQRFRPGHRPHRSDRLAGSAASRQADQPSRIVSLQQNTIHNY